VSALPGKPGRMLELDALRGIAALSVLLFHYANQFDQTYHHMGRFYYSFGVGQYGVQLFFVISGFVIFWSLERTRHAVDFAAHRFFRLFPAYWVALALTFGLVTIVGLPGQQVSIGDALLNLTMVPDFLDADSVDGSYWTLQVELFFYLQMLGWFLVGALGRFRWVILAWLLLAIAYAIAEQYGSGLSYTLRELLIVRYTCYFATGILMYRLQQRNEEPASNWILIAGALLTCWITWSWREALALLVCVILFALLIAGRLKFLSWRPLLFLGAISYTLYLLHQEIGYILIASLEHMGMSAVPSIVIATALVVICAWLLSTYVERPAIRGLRGLYDRFRARRGGLASRGAA
jgi:peptidoglycan/LPS O-acetylase OafA/YrhL